MGGLRLFQCNGTGLRERRGTTGGAPGDGARVERHAVAIQKGSCIELRMVAAELLHRDEQVAENLDRRNAKSPSRRSLIVANTGDGGRYGAMTHEESRNVAVPPALGESSVQTCGVSSIQASRYPDDLQYNSHDCPAKPRM